MSESSRAPARQGEETWPHRSMSQPAVVAGWPTPGSDTGSEEIERLAEPRQHLDARAKKLWFISELIQTVIWTVVVGAMAFVAVRFLDRGWLWPALFTGAIFATSLAWSFVGPAIHYRQWRYDIRDDEVDLQHGILVKKRQLIPMSRIQHVDTRRTPLQQRFGLASVVFFTAAGSMEIPALSHEDAQHVRNRIADLAKVHDDL